MSSNDLDVNVVHWEDVRINKKSSESLADYVANLIPSYGLSSSMTDPILGHPRNKLVNNGTVNVPIYTKMGETVIMPYRAGSEEDGIEITVKMEGVDTESKKDIWGKLENPEVNSNISWVQLVDQFNDRIKTKNKNGNVIFKSPRYIVDISETDLISPFYSPTHMDEHEAILTKLNSHTMSFNQLLTSNLSVTNTKFYDMPRRPQAERNTLWQAYLSIAIITGRRVTLLGTTKYGFIKTKDSNKIVILTPTKVTNRAHLDTMARLLSHGNTACESHESPGSMRKITGWDYRIPDKIN